MSPTSPESESQDVLSPAPSKAEWQKDVQVKVEKAGEQISHEIKAAKDWLLQEKHKERAKSLKGEVEKLFTEHPHETGETYGQHLLFTIKMGSRIIACGTAILVHGLLPFTFKRTTSRQIEEIYMILRRRIPLKRREELRAAEGSAGDGI